MSQLINQTFFRIFSRTLFITMGYLYLGYALTYYAMTQNTMSYVLDFQNSPSKSVIDGFINAALPIGTAFGALVSSSIVHKFSYRITFIGVDIFGMIVAILFTIPNIFFIIYCRLLQGFVTGMNSTLVLQYIYHFVPIDHVGFFVGLAPTLMMVGLTTGFGVQWIFLQQDPSNFDSNINYGYLGFNNWKIIFLMTLIPCFIRLLSLLILIRNNLPYEQLKSGEQDKARAQLKESYPSSQTNMEISNLIQQIMENQVQEKQTFKNLFGKEYLKCMIICIIFSICQQFAGINAVNFYAGVIVGAMTDNNITLINLANVLNGLVSLISCICSNIWINKFGRRIIFLIGNGICCISLALICIIITIQDENNEKLYSILNLIFLFTYIIAYSLSLGPVFWVYLSEVLPTKGISLVTFVNWLSCAALAQIFPIILEHFSLVYNFGLFSLICLFLEIIIYIFVFETKGKTKIEIREQFLNTTSTSSKTYVEIID